MITSGEFFSFGRGFALELPELPKLLGLAGWDYYIHSRARAGNRAVQVARGRVRGMGNVCYGLVWTALFDVIIDDDDGDDDSVWHTGSSP